MTLDRPIELDHDVPVLQQAIPADLISVPIGRVEVGDEILAAGMVRKVVARIDERGIISLECDPRFLVEYRADHTIQRRLRADETNVMPMPQHLVRNVPVVDRYEDALHEVSREKVPSQTLRQVADEMVARVVAEDRQTVELSLHGCDIDAFGQLQPPLDAEPLTLLERAYHGLTTRAPGSALCASNLREWLPDSKATVMMRTLHQPAEGKREARRAAFACLSKRYVETDMHVLADCLARALPADTTAEWRYNGDGGRWAVDATLSRPWEISVGPSTREPHQAVVTLSGHDNGAGSVRVGFKAVRLACTNGLRVSLGSMCRSVRHLGDAEKIVEQLVDAFGMVDEAMELHAARWANAYGSVFKGLVQQDDGSYLDEEISGREALRRLMALSILPTGGRQRKTVYPMYLEAFESEPGDSAVHVINAVTRFAHEGALQATKHWSPSTWAQEDCEDQAEQLFAYVTRPLAPVPEEMSWLI